MFRPNLVRPIVVDAYPTTTNLEAAFNENRSGLTSHEHQKSSISPGSHTKVKIVNSDEGNHQPGCRNKPGTYSTIRQNNNWSRSRRKLLRRMSDTPPINVLRTSLFELQDRMSHRWVLHPQSHFKTSWDLLSALIVVYYSWIIPFMLCFDWYVPSSSTRYLMKVLDFWGFVDIALRFRTGFIEYGNVVMDPRKIRQSYLRSVWFPIDVASSIPFELFIRDTVASISTRKTFKMIKYVKLPRLLRLGRFVKYLKRYKRYSSLMISLNAILFSAHVAGCLWVAILKPCTDAVEAAKPHCQDGGETDIYMVAFHHGIVSLLGVSAAYVEANDRFLSGGYGHDVSEDLNGTIYFWSSAVSIYGMILTAILFGTIIGLVQSWDRAENVFWKKMDQVSHEMDALCLPKPLRARVNAFYDYLWLNNRALSEQLNLLHDPGMSMTLRRQIAIYLFKDNLQKIPFFQLATDAVLGMICMQLHQIIYMPDDFIIHEGEIGKELFMIVKGIVRVLPPKNCKSPEDETVILLSEGDFFGEIGVVMEVERTRSVKAECMAELCVLAREGFEKILVEFPEFAIAMKKLIVKRVGEMWKDNGPERMEKMTILADTKMKRAIQTYKNMEKLRTKTRALATFRPRLSKLLNSDESFLPQEASQNYKSGPTDEIIAVATAVASSNIIDSLKGGSLDNFQRSTITETSIDETETPHENRKNDLKSESNDNNGIAVSGAIHLGSQRPLISRTSTRTFSLQLNQLEKRLESVEQRLETRMTQLDNTLEQILHLLMPSAKASSSPRIV
ncbi:putative potassium channel, voltage-dependent, EAG/ELK/ERG, rmlC-like jelly roll [Plasmopara halstedii]